MRLRNIGWTAWRGQDYNGAELRAAPGQEVEMSDDRAMKVLRDYPKRFVRAGAGVEVARDPADTSADGGSVPVVTVSAGAGDAPVPPATTTEPTHMAPPIGRRRRRRGQP